MQGRPAPLEGSAAGARRPPGARPQGGRGGRPGRAGAGAPGGPGPERALNAPSTVLLCACEGPALRQSPLPDTVSCVRVRTVVGRQSACVTLSAWQRDRQQGHATPQPRDHCLRGAASENVRGAVARLLIFNYNEPCGDASPPAITDVLQVRGRPVRWPARSLRNSPGWAARTGSSVAVTGCCAWQHGGRALARQRSEPSCVAFRRQRGQGGHTLCAASRPNTTRLCVGFLVHSFERRAGC